MSQSMTVIQADMGQTDPAKNNFVENQAGAQATASANAAALIATAIAALNLGTAAMAAVAAFDASGAASSAQTAAIASSSASLTSAIAALAAVARTGSYADLSSKPTLGTAAAQATGAFDSAGAAESAISALCAGSTTQFIRGDGSLATFSTSAIAVVTWSTLTGKPTFSTVATSGAYSDLSGLPSLGTQISVDSGWTANTYSGVKNSVLVTYSTVITGTMSTALNLVSASLGSSLVIMDQTIQLLVGQVAGLRTALVAAKLPNT